MLFVKMDGSPAVGPRVRLVTATDVVLFDGNPPGGACGRVSRRSRMEAHWDLEFYYYFILLFKGRHVPCRTFTDSRCMGKV